jgi:DNA-directed RNA polymerase subunit RPC12/RpoP
MAAEIGTMSAKQASASATRRESQPAQAVDPDEVLEAVGAELAGNERRAHPRYAFRRPVVAIPLLPDGTPDRARKVVGQSIDLSNGGMALELGLDRSLQGETLLVGMQDRDGALRFIGMQVCHARPLEDDRLLVGGQFGGRASEILQSGAQLPVLDPGTMHFRLEQPEDLLAEWVDAGIFQKVLVDRVQLCPRCGGLPTFRFACRSCGSARVTNDQLIHHYACAHVALLQDFETTEGLVCPKCRTRSLVVGSDYEFLRGPYRCADCGWTDTELEHVAHCLQCGFRFASHQASVRELYGYRADALDVTDYLPQSDSRLLETATEDTRHAC